MLDTLLDPRADTRRANLKRVSELDKAVTAYDPDDLLGGWNHGYACCISCQNGSLLELERHEEVEWDQRRKRHWPTSKKVTYTARYISAKGDILHELDFSRRGKWLDRIKRLWSLKMDLVSKTKVAKLITSGTYDITIPGTTVVHTSGEYAIVRCDTVRATQQLSAGTIWCTRGSVHAKKYTERGFYIIYKAGIRYAGYCSGECKNDKNQAIEIPAELVKFCRPNW